MKARRLALSCGLVCSLAASACVITTENGGGGAAGDANGQVENVIVVGTDVTSSIYSTGDMGLTLVPKGAGNQAVLSSGLKVSVKITTPADTFTVNVNDTTCTPKE